MSELYKIIGAEMSPFSVKVRSYFRFKGIAHQWIVRTPAIQEEYKALFKIPVIPLLVSPDGTGMQDSTPILERIESQIAEPSVQPDDPALAFLSSLLEEFGDEWGNKWMFHLRWARDVDQLSSAWRLASVRSAAAPEAEREQIARAVRERMVDRVWFVGSNDSTAPQIESGFDQALQQLELHLQNRCYLLGDRPAMADFGLAPQIYNAWTDPTGGAMISAAYPSVLAWIQRMLFPRVEGDFESWESLQGTLAPLLKAQVGERFLPWSDANRKALLAGDPEFTVALVDGAWTQKPQKYHAKSLEALRDKYQPLADHGPLTQLLQAVNCHTWLQRD
ncbi:MAG: glutathione S-transferase family protein [Pseudomonadota bacterium]